MDVLLWVGLIFTRLLVWAIAAPVHELAHAYSAYHLGDTTAARAGRLTLNPLEHMDPLGTFLLAFAGFGWAKPVPVNPYYLRYGSRMGMLLVSLAGPLSNFVLALLFALPVRLGLVAVAPYHFLGILPYPDTFLYYAITLNILLLFFNLLPIAPLDGFAILAGLLPENLAYRFEQTRQWGPFVLMGLLFLGYFARLPVLNLILDPPINAVFHLLTGR